MAGGVTADFTRDSIGTTGACSKCGGSLTLTEFDRNKLTGMLSCSGCGNRFRVEVGHRPEPPVFTEAEKAALQEGVTEEMYLALARWRERGMDQWGEEAYSKTLNTLRQDFAPWQVLWRSVPEEHQRAMRAFAVLDYERQSELVAKALGYERPPDCCFYHFNGGDLEHSCSDDAPDDFSEVPFG